MGRRLALLRIRAIPQQIGANMFTLTPALILVIGIIITIGIALILAKLTTKKPSDNGLRYEYQNPRNYRKH